MDDKDSLLRELESLLVRQCSSAQEGDLDEVTSLAKRVGDFLRESGPVIEPGPTAADPRIQRIRKLQNRLVLTLAAQKADVADRLGRLRGGKAALRAYGRNPQLRRNPRR